MQYDFETIIHCCHMDSIATDINENCFWKLPKGIMWKWFDKIPMWIVDRNFPTIPTISRKRGDVICDSWKNS